MRLKVGRSKSSLLLLAVEHVHVFVWSPQLGADSYGCTVRYRRGENWRHLRLIAGQRNRPPNARLRRRHTERAGQRFAARPTLTLAEFSTWLTEKGTKDRYDLKSYLRVKAGVGGRRVDG